MTAFWDIAPCSLVEVDRRFRGATASSIALGQPKIGTDEDAFKMSTSLGDKCCKDGLRCKQKHFILMKSRTSWIIGTNALEKKGHSIEKKYMSVDFGHTTRRSIPDDSHLFFISYKNLSLLNDKEQEWI
jgi:hypothetical protein